MAHTLELLLAQEPDWKQGHLVQGRAVQRKHGGRSRPVYQNLLQPVFAQRRRPIRYKTADILIPMVTRMHRTDSRVHEVLSQKYGVKKIRNKSSS